MRNVSRSARTSPPLLEVTGAPVLVRESDLEMLHQRLLEREARRLVMVSLPPAGPPVMLGLGHLLPGGQVRLDRGVEVTGSYWESLDRILWSNGTILYKGTGVMEEAQLMFGSVGESGTISLLPELGEEAVDMDLLRSLNINRH